VAQLLKSNDTTGNGNKCRQEHEPIEDQEVQTANQNKCPELHPNADQLVALPVKFDLDCGGAGTGNDYC
jgi:hypothetical protein